MKQVLLQQRPEPGIARPDQTGRGRAWSSGADRARDCLQPVAIHLDWHCLYDGGRVDIFDLTSALARSTAWRCGFTDRAAVEKCQRAGLPTNDHGVLDSCRLEIESKSNRYVQLLRALPAGLSEWAVHPSLGNAEAQAMEPDGWQVRKTDFDFVTSQEARDVIEEEDIIVLDYRPLQKVWTQTS